jgi:hypothetical protein
MRHTKAFLGVAAAAALAATGLAATLPSAFAVPEENPPKVTICHRTNSDSNPYVSETVAESSVDGNSGNDNGQGDHLAEHTGPVFDFNNPPPPPHNGDQWGDIIPPIDEHGNPRANPNLTLNWNAAGQAIFNNDCDPGNATVNVKKLVTGTGTPASSQTYSIELTCTLDLGAGATQVLDETVSITDGQTSQDFHVQAGAICTAVEDTTGLTNLSSATNDGPKTLVAVGGTYTLTETNDFLAPEVPPGDTPPGDTTTDTPPTVAGEVVVAAQPVVASPGFTG